MTFLSSYKYTYTSTLWVFLRVWSQFVMYSGSRYSNQHDAIKSKIQIVLASGCLSLLKGHVLWTREKSKKMRYEREKSIGGLCMLFNYLIKRWMVNDGYIIGWMVEVNDGESGDLTMKWEWILVGIAYCLRINFIILMRF